MPNEPELQFSPEKLGNLAYQIPTEGDAFSPAGFKETYEGLIDLSKINTYSPEGLADFLRILNEPSAHVWDPETVKSTHQVLTQMAQTGFTRNGTKNAKSLAEILSEQERVSYALQSPSFRKANSKSYNTVADSITYMHNVFEDIEKNAEAYFAKRLEGVDVNSKQFWEAVTDAVLEGDKVFVQHKAVDALTRYGTVKYIGQNVATAEKLGNEYENALGSLRDEIRAAIKAKSEELGRGLSATEYASITSGFKEQEEALNEVYSQGKLALGTLPKMIETLQGTAYSVLKKAEEDS